MNNIRLRALTMADREKTFSWHNQEDISDLYSGHPFPVNIEMETKWYEKILTSNIPVTVFGIEFVESNQLIGITILKDINMINRSAEFAYYIGDKTERGKGYGKASIKLTLDFAFYKLGLNRVFLFVMEENIIAIKSYLKIGFKQEGIMKESVYKSGKYKNIILMAILRDQYV